jgi:hypothetical protein
MNPGSGAVQNLRNFMVPASGGGHGVPVYGTFSAQPYAIDWRQFSIDNFPFQPQSAWVDNSQGTGDLVINIQPLNWNVTVPAGSVQSVNFPAPNGQSCTITGDGFALVIFSDLPVMPNGSVVQVDGTVQVNIAGPDPLPTEPTVNAGGTPYQNTEVPVVATPLLGSIAPAATSVTLTPAVANQFMRKCIVVIPGDATLAAAAEDIVSIILNGVTVYAEHVYIPAVASGQRQVIELDTAKIGLAAAAGDLEVTLGTALATGTVSVNALFA